MEEVGEVGEETNCDMLTANCDPGRRICLWFGTLSPPTVPTLLLPSPPFIAHIPPPLPPPQKMKLFDIDLAFSILSIPLIQFHHLKTFPATNLPISVIVRTTSHHFSLPQLDLYYRCLRPMWLCNLAPRSLAEKRIQNSPATLIFYSVYLTKHKARDTPDLNLSKL